MQKSRWRGPATVVMREDASDGTPLVYWIVQGTNLVRCAPEHVRPTVEGGETTYQDNLTEAQNQLKQVRSRSTTQFQDLTH